jgi:hypothetical protein
MDSDRLHQLEQQAYATAMKSGSWEDIERAVNIAKQIADMEQAAAENKNRPKLVRYEALKAFAVLLVPLLSVFTLAVTIFIQAALLKATREANEDTDCGENVRNVLVEQGKTPVTTEGDEVKLASVMAAFQTYGHGGILSLGRGERFVPSGEFLFMR